MRGKGSDRALWRRSGDIDAAEDEAESLLDLAGFADGRLDPDECERVAERLARDPLAAADVAAAQNLARRGEAEAASQNLIRRACALVGERRTERGRIIAWPRLVPPQPTLSGIARWTSVAAAILVASWIGFALGTDASVSFGQMGQSGDDNLMREMLDPSPGFLRDLTGGVQT